LKSKIIHHLIEENKVGFVLAEYYFDTGKVCEISDTERDPSKVCFGDEVVIKEVNSKSFLSANDETVSTSKSEDQWIVHGPAKTTHYTHGNPVSELDVLRLQHKSSGKFLHLHKSSVSLSNSGESGDLEVSLKLEGKRPEISLKLSSHFSLKDVSSDSYLASSSDKATSSANKNFWIIERIVN